MNKKRWFYIIFSTVLALIASFILCYFLLQKVGKYNPGQQSLRDPFLTVNAVRESLSTGQLKLSEIHEIGLWWITENDWNIFDNDALGTDLKISIGDKSIDRLKVVNSAENKMIHDKIEKLFLENDFYKNSKNSSNSFEDQRLYDYIQAYQKYEMRCSVTTDPDIQTKENDLGYFYVIRVACSNKVAEKYKEQLSYLQDIKEGRNVIITNIRESKGFVNLSVQDRKTEYYIMGKLENSKFREILTGKDFQQCSVLTSAGIPKEIYDNCYLNGKIVDSFDIN